MGHLWCSSTVRPPAESVSEMLLGAVSPHRSSYAGPHHCPQVSECSCYSWLIRHRRKQCADWGPILKTRRKERRKDSDHTRSFFTPEWSRVLHLFVQLYFGLGGKNRKLKKKNCWRSLSVVYCFSCVPYSANSPCGLDVCQMLAGVQLTLDDKDTLPLCNRTE